MNIYKKKGVIYLGQGIFTRDLVNRVKCKYDKGTRELKKLCTSKKVTIYEVNCNISSSTLKLRIVNHFEGFLWNFA